VPYVNGSYVPWQTPVVNGSQGFTSIVNTITLNIPWFFIFILMVVYMMLLVISIGRPGRRKYIVITFIGMLTSMIFELFSLVSPWVTGATVGLFLLTSFLVSAGEG
jgi:uncharacterized Tic20 family protein